MIYLNPYSYFRIILLFFHNSNFFLHYRTKDQICKFLQIILLTLDAGTVSATMKILYEIVHPAAAGRDEGYRMFYFGRVHRTFCLKDLGISPLLFPGVFFSVLCHGHSPFLTNPSVFQCNTFFPVNQFFISL